MTGTKKAPYHPPDARARDRIVRERARNVVVEAGAGTGKTRTLIDRVLELIAPSSDCAPAGGPSPSAIPLHRIAAITFTRKAAGELQLRIRQALLESLGRTPSSDDCRRTLLANALGELDIAFVGTIHSFADRLLRMRPVEAGISPSYEVLEEDEPILAETAELLLTDCDRDCLPAALGRAVTSLGLLPGLAEEAQRTIQDYITAGLRTETWTSGHRSRPGFDALVAAMVRQRDVPFDPPTAAAPDLAPTKAGLKRLMTRITALPGDSEGSRWLKDLEPRLAESLAVDEPVELFAELRRALHDIPKLQKGLHFPNDPEGWSFWKELTRGDKKRNVPPLNDSILAPLSDWFGRRLARLQPVVIAVYEQVKSDHECVDQTDLLIKLRDLLKKNGGGIRGFYQRLFDHILVDEFQDTDPLQAEIVFFLAEDGDSADRWDGVRLAPGRLTIVGDPKQSIYRFRRADIVTYARVLEVLEEQGALVERLETNFRSRPGLIAYYNDRLASFLGKPPETGRNFDPESGIAYYESLVPGPIPPVSRVLDILPYSDPGADKLKADGARLIEAEALARYIHWLCHSSGLRVRDRETEESRPVAYGDIAVLAQVTTNLHLLFRTLEKFGIPYAARGATLFLKEPIIRQLILGLRAVADESDGVAQAAFFRPPFFALDLADAVAGRLRATDDAQPPAVAQAAARAREARSILHDLRKSRFQSIPSRTARRLMEETAFARVLSLLPNAAQKLAAAREVLFILDALVAKEGLDFDGATARLREWIEAPVQMNPPAPVSGQAILVQTTHQAKGLEFPVVVLWDGFASIRARADGTPWRVTREGDWAIDLDGLTAGSKPQCDLIGRETAMVREEKKRLYYVAATRARDLLVVPMPTQGKKDKVSHALAGDDGCEAEGGRQAGTEPGWAARRLEEFKAGFIPEWAGGVIEAPAFPEMSAAKEADQKKLAGEWENALEGAGRPIAIPVAVTALAHAAAGRPAADESSVTPGEATAETTDLSGERDSRGHESRFGPSFGTTVHEALTVILRGSPASISDIVRACAARTGLERHLEEAARDVQHALDTLEKNGLTAAGVRRYPEYPVVLPDGGGRLITGYIDLVVQAPDGIWIIDFKTDPPPSDSPDGSYPAYKRQITIYKDLMAKATPGAEKIKARLLFTANGSLAE